MPLPDESPMQPAAIPKTQDGMPLPGMGGQQPPRINPYDAMVSVLAKEIEQANDDYERTNKSLLQSEENAWAKRQSDLDPLRQRITSFIDTQIATAPKPVQADFPKWEPKPLVNEDDYTKFGFMTLAMGLIGGLASGGDWLGVTASLNGSLKGFYQGSVEYAKRDYRDFLQKYEKARDDYQAKLNEYHEIMDNSRLTLNEMFTQYQLASDRSNDQLMMFNVQHRDLEGIRRHIETLDRMMLQTEIAQAKVNSQLGGIFDGGISDAGFMSMYLAGMPLTQMMPGLSTAVANRRTHIQEMALEYLVQNRNMTPQEAGQYIARQSSNYLGGRRSVIQQYTQLGATSTLLSNLDYNADMATKEMKKLGGVDLSPLFNAMARGEQYWTGDGRYTSLWIYMNYTINEATRISVGGAASVAQLTEGARHNAQNALSENWTTPNAWVNYVVPALKKEGRNRIQNYLDTIQQQGARSVGEDIGTGFAPVVDPLDVDVPSMDQRIRDLD